MTILLIVLHIAGALFVTASWKRGQMHFSSAMLPAVFLLPLWGPACAVAAEIHIREGEKGDEEAGKALLGEDAEILHNENWQDIEKNR